MRKPIQTTPLSSSTVRSIMQVTLVAAALALTGCASSDDSGGSRHAGNSPMTNPTNPALSSAGPLEGALKNTGGAVDNAAELGLENTLGGLGKQLDGPLKPVYTTVESTTQSLGAQTGLGEPLDGTLKQAGGAVAGIGDKVGESGLPGGLGKGAGALVTGVGDALSSAGGLLNKNENEPHPLAQTLVDATGGVRGLTRQLTNQGGLLEPLAGVLDGGLGGPLGLDGKPILQPALANAGQAVDQVLPVGLQQPLDSAGKTLDGVVAPVGGAVTQVTQTIGDGTRIGAPVDQLLTSIGGNLQQVTGGMDSTIPLGLNSVVASLGATISSAGGLVHKTSGNPNPLGRTLDNATKSLVALTNGLGVTGGQQGGLLGGILGGNGGLLGGISDGGAGGLLNGIGGGNGGLLGGIAGGNGGLLGGIAGGNGGLLSGLTGGNGGLPSGGLLSSIAGGNGGLLGGNGGNGGLLSPVTGLLSGLGGLGGK
ncbi:collagen-like triple helix repeat-containing protein [Castellaniella sp.]|uniref:collagen-like triple helix repeat-containing protein n=1 Tax=Castellaniella sp. TaxID=1955812 RepID=UPI003C75FC8B